MRKLRGRGSNPVRKSPCSMRPPSCQQARGSADGMGEMVVVDFGLGLELGDGVGDGDGDGVSVG